MSAYETLEHGEGTPLVLLHGMMGRPENWQAIFPHLPDTCKAVALRFPFFDEGSSMNSVPAVADYAQGYLDHAGLRGVALCGNSLGGHIALELALRMPGRVGGLILTGSSGLFERTFGSVGPHPPREWVRDKVCEIFHDESNVTEQMVEEVVGVISVRRNVRRLVRIAKSAKRDNVAERLGRIACPALLIWGRQDQITPPAVAEEFHQGLPDSELAWLAECGHAPMMEQPRRFGQALGRWWNRRICPVDAKEADGVAK